ncbi:ornithine cyclodeaminase family protein [Streptomyces armeniacus]|uniref:Ornithine cyclodeaminase family protein n=1 Tax=Streptomyces armeniacus TaxID=83291 RepID=A0A345XLD3_9ACTN|nr:ornithine cyclodeaminase family protein [Streptomyces armeniacus]AXK32449.1 ornithine cyclodeaminase family protein [Streptomyces armeniacus]
MHYFDAARTAARLDYDVLIPALRSGMTQDAEVPPRKHYSLGAGHEATLLVMPAWNREFLGVKLVDVFPRNAEQGLPALSSVYVLADGGTGQHLALVDGGELTRRRTVGTAALGASLLSREDSRVHLIVGTGHIGSAVYDAYAAVRPGIKTTLVADPYNPAGAEALAGALAERGVDAAAVGDLPAAAARADIITTCTLAREPVLRDEWIAPGTHLDLIGSFRPEMHEVDSSLLGRATVFIDHDAARTEAGEIVTGFAEGVLTGEDIAATLSELCPRTTPRPRADDEITVFKTVGTGLADLVAAVTVYTSTDPLLEC